LREFRLRNVRRLKYIKPVKRRYLSNDRNIEVNTFKFKKLERRINKVLIEVRNKTYRIKSRRK